MKSGNYDPSKSTSWKVLEIVLSHLKTTIKTSDTLEHQPNFLPDGYTMLMRHNKTETALHGCHCPGDMAARMRKVLARSWVGVRASLAYIVVEP